MKNSYDNLKTKRISVDTLTNASDTLKKTNRGRAVSTLEEVARNFENAIKLGFTFDPEKLAEFVDDLKLDINSLDGSAALMSRCYTTILLILHWLNKECAMSGENVQRFHESILQSVVYLQHKSDPEKFDFRLIDLVLGEKSSREVLEKANVESEHKH